MLDGVDWVDRRILDRLERGRGWRKVSGRLVTGTRAELVEQLRELVAGWEHLQDAARLVEAEAALAELENGAQTAKAGHAFYAVVEP